MEATNASDIDAMVLSIYKFVMPIIALVFTIILGFISSWIRKISKDLETIKITMATHTVIHDNFKDRLDHLEKRNNVHDNHIHDIQIQLSKL